MRIRINNLTNSPFDIQTTTGSVVLPANGAVTVDVTEDYANLLRLSPMLRVTAPRGRK